MRCAVRFLVGACVAAALLGGCDRFRRGANDAGPVDTGPRGPLVVQLPPTEDRWQVVGTQWPGAADGTGAVLLIHQLGSNRAEWGRLVERLQQPPAIEVLAIDLRGHGDSVQGPASERQTWEGFGEDPARWAGLANDTFAAVQYLLNSGAIHSVVVVGSSIGASAAAAGVVLFDERRNERRGDQQVTGLAMISPGLDYHGINAVRPMEEYAGLVTVPPRTAWMMTGERDEDSARALTTLVAAARGITVERATVAGSDAHGVSLLNADATNARWDALERYIRTTLRAPRQVRAVAPRTR